MEKLAICSKILYDKDLLSKTNKLKLIENGPNKVYKNKIEFEMAKREMFINMKKDIINWVNNQKYRFDQEYDEIWTDLNLYQYLENLTDNKEWSVNL